MNPYVVVTSLAAWMDTRSAKPKIENIKFAKRRAISTGERVSQAVTASLPSASILSSRTLRLDALVTVAFIRFYSDFPRRHRE